MANANANKMKVKEEELLRGLRIPDTDPAWNGVMQGLEFCREEAGRDAILAGLDDRSRHYNAGRAAGIADAMHWLEVMRAKAVGR